MKMKALSFLVAILVLVPASSGCLFQNGDEKDVLPTGDPSGDPGNNDTTPGQDDGNQTDNGDGDDDNNTQSGYLDYPYPIKRDFKVLDPVTLEETDITKWAVFDVNYGGNANEHYLATTKDGWILNLGGNFPYWSENRGLDWHDYSPGIPISASEGAIMGTPDRDIVAMTWTGLEGDGFIAYYYDASSGSWSWQLNTIHMPLYDRPWLTVVPGPITTATGTYPWASLVTSNFWVRNGQGYMVSVDGLNYVPLSGPPPAATIESFELDYDNPGIDFDFLTPHHDIMATPIPDGGILIPNYYGDDSDAYLRPDLTWVARNDPSGASIPGDHLVVDSTGALHSIAVSGTRLMYHLSLDGGENWERSEFSWPDAVEIEHWEFQADGVHQLAVIYIRAQEAEVDTDILLHIRDYWESVEPDTITLLGKGDIDTTPSAGASERFDFASMGILPDGGVVVAYRDDSENHPHFAVELEVPYPIP